MILWSYYFRDLGFDTRSAVAFAVFGFDARDRASLRDKKREKAAPAAFGLALSWLEKEQRTWNNASSADPVYDEVAGIAHGACSAATKAGRTCDPAALAKKVRQLNVLPDLIRMQCSMLGAWAAATPGGSLVQLRALEAEIRATPALANSTFMIIQAPRSPRS